MIIDGKAIAEEIYAALETRRAAFPRAPRLGILVAGKNAVIESFVRIKARGAERLRVDMTRVDLPPDANSEQMIDAVHALAREVDALIVQLPLPKSMDTNAVLSEIPHEKDVDHINPVSESDHLIKAPVARAVAEVLARAHVAIKGARAVVVGNGRLVGAPSAAFLKREGAHVSLFTLEEGAIEDLKDAEIIVSGAGSPGMIKPEHLTEGVVLIDAGASESEGTVVGDADPACAEKASVFTPVPGGMGPIAVAMIFKNLFDLAKE